MTRPACTCAGAVGPNGEHERWCGQIECPDCGGARELEVYVGYDRRADPPTPIYRAEKCDRCGATGRLEEEERTT
jgi:hypothetical protein